MGSRLGVVATPTTDGVEGRVLRLACNEAGEPGELEYTRGLSGIRCAECLLPPGGGGGW